MFWKISINTNARRELKWSFRTTYSKKFERLRQLKTRLEKNYRCDIFKIVDMIPTQHIQHFKNVFLKIFYKFLIKFYTIYGLRENY